MPKLQEKPRGRDYGRILAVLKAVDRPLCPFEFSETDLGLDFGCLSGREWVGQTESTIARRLREAARLGLVLASKRRAQSGAWLAVYSLPGTDLKPETVNANRPPSDFRQGNVPGCPESLKSNRGAI